MGRSWRWALFCGSRLLQRMKRPLQSSQLSLFFLCAAQGEKERPKKKCPGDCRHVIARLAVELGLQPENLVSDIPDFCRKLRTRMGQIFGR